MASGEKSIRTRHVLIALLTVTALSFLLGIWTADQRFLQTGVVFFGASFLAFVYWVVRNFE